LRAPTSALSPGPIISARERLAKKPVKSPRDLAGPQIRTLPIRSSRMPAPDGAAATPLAFGEIYTALQAGVLDGSNMIRRPSSASKFYETLEELRADAAHLLAARDLFQRCDFNRMDASCARVFSMPHEGGR